jgi:hypothetical protein
MEDGEHGKITCNLANYIVKYYMLTIEELRTELRIIIEELRTGLGTELRAELRAALAPIHAELTFVRQSIIMLQQDTRLLRAAVNDFARTNLTAGEIQALHDDVNRVQSQNTELEIRMTIAEQFIKELREGSNGTTAS